MMGIAISSYCDNINVDYRMVVIRWRMGVASITLSVQL